MRRAYSRFGVTTLSLAALAVGYFAGRPLMERAEFARAQSEVDSARKELSTVEDLSTIFRHVGQIVEPSVVEIQATIQEHSANQTPEQEQDPLRHFFRFHGDEQPGQGGSEPEPDQIGTGSGVIMEAADGYGYILTNNHVAGNATEIKVMLADGRLIKAANCTLMGTDPKSDLAVVKIKADRLIAAKWGNSDELEKGDWIMAFGSPFGYVGSMTHGIVSALHRDDVGILAQSGGYENFIQVDAPINPGNSGGPLVNIHGEVVGINTAIATVSGGFQGIGFAIPSNQAIPVYNELKLHGKVIRGWLGISLSDLSKTPGMAKSFGYTGDGNVLVEQIFSNTPASGKLQVGDIIEAYNGTTVASGKALRDMVAATAPGATATVRVFRQGKEVDVPIIIGDQPANLAALANGEDNNAGENAPPAPQEAHATKWGLTLKTLDDDMISQLGLHGVTAGAVITGVEHGSIAAHANLRPGIVITRVGSTPVTSAADANDALSKADVKVGVRLYIATPSGSSFLFLQSPDAGN